LPGLRAGIGELADCRDFVLKVASHEVVGQEDGEADEELFDVHVFLSFVFDCAADSAPEARNRLYLGNC